MSEHSENIRRIVPAYALTIGDLEERQGVQVLCLNCGHRGVVHHDVLTTNCAPFTRVRDLKYMLRCERCRVRGEVDVTVYEP
jgi:hypothetical protein